MSYNDKHRFQNEYTVEVADDTQDKACNFRTILEPLVNHTVWIEGNLVDVSVCMVNSQQVKDCVVRDVQIVKTASVIRNVYDWDTVCVDHMHVFVSKDFEFIVPSRVRVKGIMKRYLKQDNTQNLGLQVFTIRILG